MGWWIRLGEGSKRFLMALALVLLAAAVFGQVGAFRFIAYDDQSYVFKNSMVMQGLTWQGLRVAFSSTLMHCYAPLTTLAHMVDCQLFGLNSGAHHLMSLGVHMANALLLFSLLLALSGAPWRSWFVAALFTVHPMHVEAIAWIAERKELLSTLFGLVALLAYVRYVRRPSLLRYVPVGLFLMGALLCKPMLVTLPFVMLLLDLWPLRRVPWPPLGQGRPPKNQRKAGAAGSLLFATS